MLRRIANGTTTVRDTVFVQAGFVIFFLLGVAVGSFL